MTKGMNNRPFQDVLFFFDKEEKEGNKQTVKILMLKKKRRLKKIKTINNHGEKMDEIKD